MDDGWLRFNGASNTDQVISCR